MYRLLIALMLLTGLPEFEMSLKDFEGCSGRGCLVRIEKASRKILKIDWKPISVWPEGAKRFVAQSQKSNQ